MQVRILPLQLRERILMSDYERDKWIKDNLPSNCGPEMKMAMEIVMRLAYNEGLKAGQRKQRSQSAEDERERIHGPWSI